MTAPERLWAWYDYDEDGWDNAYATTINNIPHSSEFVRADLHAALQAENERLREALTNVAIYIPDSIVECRGDKCREPWCASCFGWDEAEQYMETVDIHRSTARAALK